MIGLRNCGHLGRVGDWAEMAAASGQVSLHFLNTSGAQRVAPYGGSDRRLSTNPICIGVPVADGDPVILDVTTSTVAEGKLMVAREQGREGAARAGSSTATARRRPTRRTFYDGGALLTVGAHKGSGLSIVTDLLAGAVSTGRSSDPARHGAAQQHAVDLHRARRVCARRQRRARSAALRRLGSRVAAGQAGRTGARAGRRRAAHAGDAPAARRADRRHDLGGLARSGKLGRASMRRKRQRSFRADRPIATARDEQRRALSGLHDAPHPDDRRRRSAASSAATARRCCCCTAIRRRTRCGIASRRRSRASYTVVCADLRGYGDSGKPPSRRDPRSVFEARDGAGHGRADARPRASRASALAGHDRGGRVAHRLCLDHPDAVSRGRGARHLADRARCTRVPTRRSRPRITTGSS